MIPMQPTPSDNNTTCFDDLVFSGFSQAVKYRQTRSYALDHGVDEQLLADFVSKEIDDPDLVEHIHRILSKNDWSRDIIRSYLRAQ